MLATTVLDTLRDVLENARAGVTICVKEDDEFSKPKNVTSIRFERTEKNGIVKDSIVLLYSDKPEEAQ